MARAATASPRCARPGATRRRAAARVPVARPAAPGPGARVGPTRPVRERGVALVLALVLLIATSVLAVATLSGTRLGETMASNAQNKAIAFEVAESGIDAAWTDRPALATALGSTPGNDPDPSELDALTLGLTDGYDQRHDGDVVLDLNGDLSVQFCGETASISGSDMNANLDDPGGSISVVFDIVSAVDSTGAVARARHVQRGAMNGPKLGRTGACPAP